MRKHERLDEVRDYLSQSANWLARSLVLPALGIIIGLLRLVSHPSCRRWHQGSLHGCVPTARRRLPSAVPGFLVGFDAEPIHQLVVPAEEVHDGHQFEYAFVVQTELPHRGSVHVESIDTAVHG